MTQIEINKIKRRIVRTLNTHAHVSPSRSRGLLQVKDLVGKLYEAEVLATICENLVTKENLRVTLQGRGKVVLKTKGTDINRSYPYFQVWKNGKLFGELFTDVYFNTISSISRGGVGKFNGDYHELDIVLLEPGVTGKPKPGEIFLAVECKNTVLKKNLIRELLGFRRELSYLHAPLKTKFDTWPVAATNASPPSVHMLYISKNKFLDQYKVNCKIFGILLEHHPM